MKLRYALIPPTFFYLLLMLAAFVSSAGAQTLDPLNPSSVDTSGSSPECTAPSASMSGNTLTLGGDLKDQDGPNWYYCHFAVTFPTPPASSNLFVVDVDAVGNSSLQSRSIGFLAGEQFNKYLTSAFRLCWHDGTVDTSGLGCLYESTSLTTPPTTPYDFYIFNNHASNSYSFSFAVHFYYDFDFVPTPTPPATPAPSGDIGSWLCSGGVAYPPESAPPEAVPANVVQNPQLDGSGVVFYDWLYLASTINTFADSTHCASPSSCMASVTTVDSVAVAINQSIGLLPAGDYAVGVSVSVADCPVGACAYDNAPFPPDTYPLGNINYG
ncbi:MAG TPA: hypothetical protein VLL52_22530, partial [Anaerolineae bacterium]|nr:hypothetical protein [Anaerolineae bacterium]